MVKDQVYHVAPCVVTNISGKYTEPIFSKSLLHCTWRQQVPFKQYQNPDKNLNFPIVNFKPHSFVNLM